LFYLLATDRGAVWALTIHRHESGKTLGRNTPGSAQHPRRTPWYTEIAFDGLANVGARLFNHPNARYEIKRKKR